jgi:hypothetical protein
MVWVDIQYEIADSDSDVSHVIEDVPVMIEVVRDRILAEKVYGVEQISDGVYSEVEDTIIIYHRPQLTMYLPTDSKQGKWLRDNLVFELFIQKVAIESVLASSHVASPVSGERIAIDHQADLGRQTKEVKGLCSPVAEFEL